MMASAPFRFRGFDMIQFMVLPPGRHKGSSELAGTVFHSQMDRKAPPYDGGLERFGRNIPSEGDGFGINTDPLPG